MKNLIKKELIVNRKYFAILLLQLPVLIPMMLFVDGDDKRYMVFILTMVFFTYFTSSNVIVAEERSNTPLLYASLPINREDIVKSKYFIHLLFLLICSSLLYLITTIINYYTLYKYISIGPEVLVIAFSISLIIQAIIIPMIYSGDKILYLVTVLSIGIIYLGLIFKVVDHERELVININYGILSIVLAILAVLLYFLSMRISIKILKEGWEKE